MNEDMARSIRARMRGLPHVEVDGYNFNEHVSCTLDEETPPPPELYEPDLNSAAGIDPASDTRQAVLGNCSSRKTTGQLLSTSMEIDGTAGSEEIFEKGIFPE